MCKNIVKCDIRSGLKFVLIEFMTRNLEFRFKGQYMHSFEIIFIIKIQVT